MAGQLRMERRSGARTWRAAVWGGGAALMLAPAVAGALTGQMGWDPADFPNSERYYGRALSLPMFPGMGPEDVTRVVRTLQGPLD